MDKINTRHWQYSGDVNMLDYGGKFIREVPIGKRVGDLYQLIEITNMDEACGRDNEGHGRYVVELSAVDLFAIPEDRIESAMASCGLSDKDLLDIEASRGLAYATMMLAEAVYSYGAKALLDSWEGNNGYVLLKQAKRRAKELKQEVSYNSALQRPVNRLGETAHEYMTGDMEPAIQRGVAAGDKNVKLFAKIMGYRRIDSLGRISDP